MGYQDLEELNDVIDKQEPQVGLMPDKMDKLEMTEEENKKMGFQYAAQLLEFTLENIKNYAESLNLSPSMEDAIFQSFSFLVKDYSFSQSHTALMPGTDENPGTILFAHTENAVIIENPIKCKSCLLSLDKAHPNTHYKISLSGEKLDNPLGYFDQQSSWPKETLQFCSPRCLRTWINYYPNCETYIHNESIESTCNKNETG